MSGLPKKCEYALRAVFELAYRNAQRPVTIHDIALAQGVPPRFLEGIMSLLRHAGVVESRRGSEGGYFLAAEAKDIRVADVVEIVEGGLSVGPLSNGNQDLTNTGDFAFGSFWRDVDDEVTRVLQDTSIADLVENERTHQQERGPDYHI